MSAKESSAKGQTEGEPGQDGKEIESTEKMERIREIVFGAQTREYDQRFDNLGRDVQRLQQEVARLAEQIGEQNRLLSERISNENAQLAAQLKEQGVLFSQQLQELDNRLGGQLRDLGQHSSSQFQDVEQRHSARIQEIDAKYSQRGDDLQRALHIAEENLRADLRQNSESLGNAKADRLTLGDMLVQMGNSLKENGGAGMAADLLEELINEIE